MSQTPSRSLLPVLSGWLLLTGLAGCGPSLAEQFAQAKSLGTVDALDSFVLQHPENPYYEEIAGLREELRFREVSAAATEDALLGFLAEFAESSHEAEVQQQLDGLRFAAAERAGTQAAYQSYLDKQPQGAQVVAARREIERLALAGFEKSGTPTAIKGWAGDPGRSPEARDRALRLLDARVSRDAGAAGLIRFPVSQEQKYVDYRWIEGFAGGRLLEIAPDALPVPEVLGWEVRGKGKKAKLVGPTLTGKLTVALLSPAPPTEQVQLVALLKVAGNSLLAAQPLKLPAKALAKKKTLLPKVKLVWPEVPEASGKARLHLLLIRGELPASPTELKPISNILVRDIRIDLPADRGAADDERSHD